MGGFWKPFKKMFRFNYIAAIVGSIGLGMLMVLIFPPWIWILIVAITLITWACRVFFL